LVRFATIAALLGAFTGIWVLLLNYGAAEAWSWLSTVAALSLVIASLISLFSPRIVFYASALLAIVLDGSLVVGSALNLVAILTLALGAVAFATALVAARREGRVSEQSNPMNLPVFG
jgi:hypothetical protein